jgi:hypothetical protein
MLGASNMATLEKDYLQSLRVSLTNKPNMVTDEAVNARLNRSRQVSVSGSSQRGVATAKDSGSVGRKKK